MNIRCWIPDPSAKNLVVVDAAPAIIVADAREKGQDQHTEADVPPGMLLSSGGGLVILGLAMGYELDNCDGDCGQQEHMNEAALMQDELQNEPNKQNYSTNRPHSRNLFLANSGSRHGE